MMNPKTLVRVLALASILIVPATVGASGLDSFLDDLDVRARVDLRAFKTDLSVTFGISGGRVDGLFEVMSRPSDVYMCLRIGEVARQPIDRVVAEYKRSQGQGWGTIAKNLGIKPGSDEFHALKAGRLPRHDGGRPSGGKGNGGKGRK